MNPEPVQSTRSLDRKFAGGVLWTAGGKWATQALTFLSVILVARLLSPAEIGLASMAGIFQALVALLAEFGLGSAVVQLRDLEDEAVAQLQTVALGICTLFFGLVAVASPLVALYFNTEELRWLVVVNSTAILILGVQSIPLALLRKALNYKRLAILEVVDQLVRAALTVAAAFAGASYWSPVIGGLTARVFVTVFALRWAPSRYAFPRWETIRRPLVFGLRVSVSGFVNVLSVQMDPIVVAKRLGENALGIYRLAIDLGSAPSEKINTLLMRVSGPLMASIQHDLTLVRRYFLRIAEPLSMMVFPAVAGFALVIPEVVPLVLGSQWREAALPMRLITMSMGIGALTALTGQVLQSMHEIRFLMWISIAKFVSLPFAFYYASEHGLASVAMVWLYASPIELILVTWKMVRRISLSMSDYWHSLMPAVAGTVAMVAIVLLVQRTVVLEAYGPVANLGATILVGATCYLLVLVVFFRNRLQGYIEFARNNLRG